MTRRVLIVEDEPKVARVLQTYLEQAGFAVLLQASGQEVVSRVRQEQPDLILLDLMLPGGDGLEICRTIRTFSSVPVIIITARVEEIDRILGLELGADDYICKPFSPREVLARVKAVLRRADGSAAHRSAGLVLDEARYRGSYNGRDFELTAVEFKLLQFLAARPGRIYSRQYLMDRIYPDDRVVADRTIDSHIKKLRKKIAVVSPDVDLIHSVYGVGYKFEIDR